MEWNDPELVEGSLAWNWLEQGRAEGRAEALAQARAAGPRRIFLRVLRKRFGALPPWATKCVEAMSIEELERGVEPLLDGGTLEQALPDALAWQWLLRGRDEGARRVFLRMFTAKFGPLPHGGMLAYNVHTMSVQDLEELSERMLTTEDPDALFDGKLSLQATRASARDGKPSDVSEG